ncbi:hypothetical protein MKX01_023197, partial [Papaver californicum]
KVIRAAPPFKAADEMIGISVPRKARSASVKRSHEYWISGGGGGGGGGVGEALIHRQASTSPARPIVPSPPPPPVSPPSSSNVSVCKKMKPTAPKQRPPKISKTSTVQEEIEIEVAEVLFGLMRQSQCSSSNQEATNVSSSHNKQQDTNGSSNDAKSRVSSPISASATQPLAYPTILSSSSNTSAVLAVAPKRKRPRPVKVEDENLAGRNLSNPSATSIENELAERAEVSSPKLKKNHSGSTIENGGLSLNRGSSYHSGSLQFEPHPELAKTENSVKSDSKALNEEESIGRDSNHQIKEETPVLAKNESLLSSKIPEDLNTIPKVSTTSKVEVQKEGKLEIDLMAIPMKSPPERDGLSDFASDPRPIPPDNLLHKIESVAKDGAIASDVIKQNAKDVGLVEKIEEMAEESVSQKQNFIKERISDLHPNLEKQDIVGNASNLASSKQYQEILRLQQQFKAPAQPMTMPLSMTVPGWSGGPRPVGFPIGQVPTIQGVVSVDEVPGALNVVQLPHFPPAQPRPKRCATHCYIARNIYYHQQFTRMNQPYWPAGTAASASVYGSKYNLNGPPTETAIAGNPFPGGFPGRTSNLVQDKGQVVTALSSHSGKDKSSSGTNMMDCAQRKQLVLQQAPQPTASGNLVHGPAFIFPLGQQQSASAPRYGAIKSASTTGNAASSNATSSVPNVQGKNSSSTTGAATVSFNYPNMQPNEAQQYLAVLQNSGYPFPIPSHVGAPPSYRGGTQAQAMPFFNGPFYSQMLHPSQIQQQLQQQQQQQQPNPQPQVAAQQQGHQKTSTSSGSSSSLKHQQQHQPQQQQRLQGSGSGIGGGGGAGNPQGFPVSKSRPQQHQNLNVQPPRQSRQLESQTGSEDVPSAGDSRVSHAQKAMYGQNFPMAMHLQNFSFMPGAAIAGGASGNPGEKLQQSQQLGSKGGVDVIQPQQSFTMSFPSFNGAATTGIDFSSMPQIFQSLPEAARNGYQAAAVAAVAAAQAAASQQKNHHISEEGKSASDSMNTCEDERKGGTGKGGSTNVGQSLVFSRPDSSAAERHVSASILSSNVMDTSARTLNLISSPLNNSSSNKSSQGNSTPPTVSTTGATTNVNMANSQIQKQHKELIQIQMQQQMHIQQQMFQHHHMQKQHEMHQELAARTKQSNSTTSSSVYSERISASPSTISSKFPNCVSVFPPGLMQSSSSPVHSPQWKNSARTASSSSPSLVSITTTTTATTSSLKNLPQQHQRLPQGHTQISFGMNAKSAATGSHGQQISNNIQSPSSPGVVGSPPTSHSKGTVGSPRTTAAGSKVGTTSAMAPSMSSPQLSGSKNAPSPGGGPSRKSSPVGGRSAPPSILGGGNPSSHSANGTNLTKQQQQFIQKQMLQQQAQFSFSNPYIQAQNPQPSSSATGTTQSNYHQRGQQPEQQQQQQQKQQHQQPNSSASTTSTGMLTMCSSLSLAGGSSTDPTKSGSGSAGNNSRQHQAAQFAAAAPNSHPFMPTTFPYVHGMPAIQVKSAAEQKQPAGNDNLHASWQPEKKR